MLFWLKKPLKNASKVRENDLKTGPKNVKMFQFDEHAIESIEDEITVDPGREVRKIREALNIPGKDTQVS